MLLLESLIQCGQPLGKRLDALQRSFGFSHYDRIDLRLKDLLTRQRLEQLLKENPPSNVAGETVKEVITTDGVKLRLNVMYWLMFRFSGTEPLLRIYCEAPTKEQAERIYSKIEPLLRHKIKVKIINCFSQIGSGALPNLSIPSFTVSPPFKNTGGFIFSPTPGGVPVQQISPGKRLIQWLI